MTTQYVNEAEECDAVALISEGRVVATGTPDELRRKAVGGDEIAIETREAFDAGALRDVAGVRRLEQRGPTEVRVTVADGAATLPDVVEAITGGRRVVSAAETGRRSTRSSRSWSSQPRRARIRRRRRQGRLTCMPRSRSSASARVRRQGAHRDDPPAGSAGEPRAGAVPDHGRLRRGLQRRSPTARDVIVVPDTAGCRPTRRNTSSSPAHRCTSPRLSATGHGRGSAARGPSRRRRGRPGGPGSGVPSRPAFGHRGPRRSDRSGRGELRERPRPYARRRRQPQLIERAVEEGTGYVVEAGEAAAAAIPPDVVAAPRRRS